MFKPLKINSFMEPLLFVVLLNWAAIGSSILWWNLHRMTIVSWISHCSDCIYQIKRNRAIHRHTCSFPYDEFMCHSGGTSNFNQILIDQIDELRLYVGIFNLSTMTYLWQSVFVCVAHFLVYKSYVFSICEQCSMFIGTLMVLYRTQLIFSLACQLVPQKMQFSVAVLWNRNFWIINFGHEYELYFNLRLVIQHHAHFAHCTVHPVS